LRYLEMHKLCHVVMWVKQVAHYDN
jgi:hypothetical protein